MNDSQVTKPKRWTRRLAVALLLLAIGVFVGWRVLLSVVEARFKSSLVDLAMGEPTIGSISVRGDGVRANDVVFVRDGESEPWLSVGELAIQHPISGLAAGDETYDGLAIDGLRVNFDLDDSQSEQTIDLAEIELPSKQISIANATFVLQYAGSSDKASPKKTLLIDQISATVRETAAGINLSGKIGDLAGSHWRLVGSTTNASKDWTVKLKSEQVNLVDGQWQDYPGIPDGIGNYLQADIQSDVQIELNSDRQGGFRYSGIANLKDGKLNLPQFKLPIEIKEGKVTVGDGVVQFDKLVGTMDGADSVSVSASTTIDAFPIETTFNANYRDLDVVTLRKLAAAIPIEVTGKASGGATGSVVVEESLRTTLVVNGSGKSSMPRYGSIVAQAAKVDVKITPLIFDSKQAFESIEGSVTVTADAAQQSAKDVFLSLGLTDLERQLEVEANASGTFRLELPLASAAFIETWEMDVSATAETGKFCQQSIRDLRLKASLANGKLDFSEIVAVPVGQSTNGSRVIGPASPANPLPSSLVRASVEWPITSTYNPSDTGKMSFGGQQVPTGWMIQLLNRQIQNATSNDVQAVSEHVDRLAGEMTFETVVKVNANQPTDIGQWSGGGTISDSTVIADGQRLKNLNSKLGLNRGTLTFSELQANFDSGGQIDARGDFSLADGLLKSANLNASSMPLNWIVNVASQSIPAVGERMQNIGITPSDTQDRFAGNLSAQFQLLPSLEGKPWVVSATIESPRLTVKGETMTDLSLSGSFDSKTIEVTSARAGVGARGQIDLQGSWSVAKETGNGQLSWQRLPLNWLAGFTTSNKEMFAGLTSGEVNILNRPDANGFGPYSVQGSVSAEGLEFAGLKSRELGFDIRTKEGMVLLDGFQMTGDFDEVDLAGTLELNQPFCFALDGKVKRLPLSKLFARPSVTEKVRSAAVTGTASGTFGLAGDLQAMRLNSDGNIKCSNLTFNGKRLSDISARWNDLGIDAENDWSQSSISVTALGGSIRMTELSQNPQRVRVELADINAQELTSLTSLPTKLTGSVSGDASLNEWAATETRWADLNLRGASVVVGPADFGDLSARVEYRENDLKYSVGGRLLNGKFDAEGRTTLNESILKTELPLQVQFTNGSLNGLYRSMASLSSLRSLQGSLAANANLVVRLDQLPSGNGVVKVNDLTWNSERLTREISSNVKLVDGVLKLDKLRADLQRGEISGRASIPIKADANGTYELNVRGFDLQRFLEVIMEDPVDGVGLVDARISGRVGRTISGQGLVSVNRAEVLGLSGRTLRVPIQFQYQPLQQTAKVEIRRSRFQVFNGNVTGTASIDIGKATSLKTDLKISMLDTDALFASLAGLENSGQGKLSGDLKLAGNSIRSLRDLKGSFKGDLSRAEAFQLPLLESVARFLGGNQLQSKDFESNDIDLRLGSGRIEVRRLNFSNSLAQIAITGNAYLDGRLDLDLAARIERINQPTLVEQLLGSPLSRFRGSPVALFAQAADFLSERLIFVQIDGTFQRPLVRPDAGKQLQEETIRYFLRGSQILPKQDILNN